MQVQRWNLSLLLILSLEAAAPSPAAGSFVSKLSSTPCQHPCSQISLPCRCPQPSGFPFAQGCSPNAIPLLIHDFLLLLKSAQNSRQGALLDSEPLSCTHAQVLTMTDWLSDP